MAMLMPGHLGRRYCGCDSKGIGVRNDACDVMKTEAAR